MKNNNIMLKINYIININKYNTKFLKITPQILIYIFNKIFFKKKIKLIFFKKKIKLKTLMMSPFHYKVAKKNISNTSQKLKICINCIKINELLFLNIKQNYNELIILKNLNLINYVHFYEYKI